jgi:heme exporter protein B
MTSRGNRVTPSTTNASFWQVYAALLKKDMRMEMRTHEMLTSMVLYALLVLTVYGAALSQTSANSTILSMSGGLLWAVVIFTSLLGLNRSFAREKETGCIEGVLLAPIDRAAIFLAKTTSNLLFLVLVEIIVVPLFIFFFLTGGQLTSLAWLMPLPLLVGTIGIAGVGTLLSTMTMNTSGKDVMLAILFIPLIFPLLYACVGATSAIIMASAGWFDTFWRSLVLAVGYDVIMVAACFGLYGFVIDS